MTTSTSSLSRTTSLLIAMGLSAVLILLVWWFARVKTIYCFVQYANCSPEILQSVRELRGSRLLLTDFDTKISNLLAGNPDVSLASFHKTFPDTLVITLRPQKVAYVFQVDEPAATAIITSAGTVLQADVRADWQVVWITPTMLTEVQNTMAVDQTLHQQLQSILSDLSTTNWQVTAIALPDWQTLQVTINNQLTFLMPINQATLEIQRAVDLLHNLPDNQRSQIQEIDLRYKLPVLRQTRTIPRHDSQ